MIPPPYVDVVLQRQPGDCGMASLAMYLGKSYEDVFAVAITLTQDKKLHRRGMENFQIIGCAEVFGVRLRTRRKWDMATACGVLCVKVLKPKKGAFEYHAVLLRWGLVFDTDGTVWPVADFMAVHGFRPVSLITG